MRRAWGCLVNLVFVGFLLAALGFSSYFSFKFFVRGESIRTPDLIGRPISEARGIASDLGLILEIDESRSRHSGDVEAGSVVWQSRRPRRFIKRGTSLYVAESLGSLVQNVPDLSDVSARAALVEFSQRNINVGNLSHLDVVDYQGVVATNPPVGTVVKSERPISVLVAIDGSVDTYVMPDLIDLGLDKVRQDLEAFGLEIDTVRFEIYPGIPDGTIIRQFPLPGAPVSAKRPITIVASRGGQSDPFR